jgi:hypothetical protein
LAMDHAPVPLSVPCCLRNHQGTNHQEIAIVNSESPTEHALGGAFIYSITIFIYSITISTRRFFSRLTRLSLGAIGLVRPNP